MCTCITMQAVSSFPFSLLLLLRYRILPPLDEREGGEGNDSVSSLSDKREVRTRIDLIAVMIICAPSILLVVSDRWSALGRDAKTLR